MPIEGIISYFVDNIHVEDENCLKDTERYEKLFADVLFNEWIVKLDHCLNSSLVEIVWLISFSQSFEKVMEVWITLMVNHGHVKQLALNSSFNWLHSHDLVFKLLAIEPKL